MTDSDLEQLEAVVGPVSRETFDRLQSFSNLVRRWTRTTNLVSSSTLETIWTRHIVDSAQLVRLVPYARSWTDIGSGGGFPGIVVAILLQEHAASWRVDLVESNQKKAAFLRIAAGDLQLSGITVHSSRAETILPTLTPEIVTARALASLSDLLSLTGSLLENGAKALFHKGRDYQAELEKADSRWSFDVIIHPNQVSADGVILELSDLRRRPGAG